MSPPTLSSMTRSMPRSHKRDFFYVRVHADPRVCSAHFRPCRGKVRPSPPNAAALDFRHRARTINHGDEGFVISIFQRFGLDLVDCQNSRITKLTNEPSVEGSHQTKPCASSVYGRESKHNAPGPAQLADLWRRCRMSTPTDSLVEALPDEISAEVSRSLPQIFFSRPASGERALSWSS
jgi:hypothetical protein